VHSCGRPSPSARTSGEPAQAIGQTIALQEEFLRMHLGAWIGAFCGAVVKHASTDFYRGFVLILDAYIRMDKEWLRRLAGQS